MAGDADALAVPPDIQIIRYPYVRAADAGLFKVISGPLNGLSNLLTSSDARLNATRANLTRLLIFALLVSLSCSLVVTAGQSQGTVSAGSAYGTVTDVDGNPIRGVSVTVSDSHGSIVTRTQTASGGDFGISSLDQGTYSVQFSKRGYQAKTLSITISRTYTLIDLGQIVLDYSLQLSIAETYLRVNCLSDISIAVTVANVGSEDEPVTMSVEAPDGWDAGIYSGSAEIIQLTTSPGYSKTLSLEVWVPYNSSGLYNLTVTAVGWTTQECNVSVYVDKVDPQILSSKYPFARTTPGSTVAFDLTISNVLAKGFASVVLVECPTGWTADVTRQDGSQLYGISLKPGDIVQAGLALSVPGTAAPGTYQVVVSVKASDFESSLALSVTVVTGEPQPRLQTDTPYIDVYAGHTAEYLVTVGNVGDSDGILNITLEGLPAGYNWVAKDPSGSVISKLYLKAGESKQLKVDVTVPPLAEPDVKSLALQVGVGNAVDRLNLSLGILGWYSIAYVTQDFYVESLAGQTTAFQISVQNTGYSSLTNAKLETSGIPSGLSVKVDPSVVLLLSPQGSATYTVTITTDASITAGDYYVTLNLSADQAQVPVRSLHVYVKQSGEVVYVGAGIVIVVAAALFVIYRKYGRR